MALRLRGGGQAASKSERPGAARGPVPVAFPENVLGCLRPRSQAAPQRGTRDVAGPPSPDVTAAPAEMEAPAPSDDAKPGDAQSQAAHAPLPDPLSLRPPSSIPRSVIEAVQADLDELTAKKETANAELAQLQVSINTGSAR